MSAGSSIVKKLIKGKKIPPSKYDESKPNENYEFIPVDIDEDCIVGWGERYYRELPKASKGDFLGDDTGTQVKVTGEIREPKHFKGLINPYTNPTNEKFKYLMDCLNDRLSKKDLGAFYTPMPYAKKAAELVKMAVDRVPEGNDYIILDRCAGTGNLESALIGLKDRNGDELISHSIVSTYEYYEYKVLNERIGDLVREIIPPTEADVVYSNGKVSNADAMSKDFIENPIIRQYVDNPKCTIILFENPPFHDETSNSNNSGKKKRSYVTRQMSLSISKRLANQIGNRFIWSAQEYFLRQPTDSYILFCPINYFKSFHLMDKRFVKGFLFNRGYFHATISATSCILWQNKKEKREVFPLTVTEIEEDVAIECHSIDVRKVYATPAAYFDKRKSDDFIGFMNISGFNLDAKSVGLYRNNTLHGHGSCFFLYTDVYIIKLPLFVAKMYPRNEWWEKGECGIYFTTSDGGDTYTHDANFLKTCLIYTCLSNQNKCLTFDGSDGRHYQNELCFDTSNEANLPLAFKDLMEYNCHDETVLDEDENELMELWWKILAEARKTKNYDKTKTYGVYQITKELNTFHQEGKGKAKKNIYDYPELNGDLNSLRDKLKEYYKSHITSKMFKYELLK